MRNAENIHAGQTENNLYWDWENGLRTHAENVSGQYPPFTQVEHDFYEQRYGAFLAGQAERNIKAGHAKRNRTVDDLLSDVRVCPEESIYQIGKEGDCPPPEVLQVIVQDFMTEFNARFGSHVHIIDWALHLDETSPHIHARQVFDVENSHGEIEPKQEKALEALGVPLPFPEQKSGRNNNRKITFDGICREMILDICKKRGLDIETRAVYGGKKHREKNDYIIAKQMETIREQEHRLGQQQSQIETLTKQITEKDAELEEKELKLSDVDALLDDVADIAYEKAMYTVAATAIHEAKRKVNSTVDAVITGSREKESGIGMLQRKTVDQWLGRMKNRIAKAMETLFSEVIDKLSSPRVREAAKAKIRDAALPSVLERLKPRISEKEKRDSLSL